MEGMGSVVACRAVGNGGSRDQNPAAVLLLNRFQLETGRREGQDLAREPYAITIEHFLKSVF
jgi:hypothetical protein